MIEKHYTPERPWHWFILEVNPEPWAVGDLSIGRKNGKMFPMMGRNQQLFAYKEAVKEEIGKPELFIEGKIELQFYFWRRRDEYTTPQQRGHRKHEADGTNMAKATEDALQGLLFKNDKDVNSMNWYIVEQGPDVTPRVVIGIRPGVPVPDAVTALPDDVLQLIEMVDPHEANQY